MGKKYRARVSKEYRNPLIMAQGLNPIRKYVAEGEGETLSGIIFDSQEPVAQIKHHAKVRGLGDIDLNVVSYQEDF